MENEVPYAGFAFVLSILLTAVSAALVRRPLFAYLFGVLFTAIFVGYCMYYAGPVEMGGWIHALFGGLYGIGFYYFFRWLRKTRSAGREKE
jgi:prepilin signal peptidase PulO-like enzyme (type II secretory pathway)